MMLRIGYGTLGGLLVVIGVFLPQDWYDALPKQAALPPPPFKGVTLLQIVLVVEGLALIWISLKRWTFTCLGDAERLPMSSAAEENETSRTQTSLWLLGAIFLLGLSLRLFHLNSDLWLDEITPILDYGHLSPLEVVGSFLSTNNHLLNTLLVKLAMACFGEKEWAIRLPAVVFGTATIPVVYWLARLALPQGASLAAALLLAVSYHHIFFSQNARGYSAYLFFSLLASALLVRGLQEDRARIWVLYVITMFLNFASLLISGFVFAAHAIVGAAALSLVKRRGASPLPLLRRLSIVFAVPVFLAFQLYATVLPQVYVVMTTVYTNQASGDSPSSKEFLAELARGIAAGFGTGVVIWALPFLLVSTAGLVILFRKQWALTLALTMPGVLTGIFLIVGGLSSSPRFFLLALPLAILAAVSGVYSFSKFVGRILGSNEGTFCPRLTIAVVLVISAISMMSLKYYYSVPKQAYRASIKYLEEERKEGEIIIVVYLAEIGYRYYGRRFSFKEDTDYFFVHSATALDAVLSSRDGRRSLLVTTFPRALRLKLPNLYTRITKDWAVARTFPGTIGDGAISIWKPRQL